MGKTDELNRIFLEKLQSCNENASVHRSIYIFCEMSENSENVLFIFR